MAGKYRRYYIGIPATLVTLFLALQLYGLQIIDVSGDIYCTDTCVSYFDVRNPTYRSIYIYNKESISLDFSPKIKDYELYIKYYGKWRKMDFTMATRLPNVPKSRVYVFVFPRYSIKHFKLVGKKDTWQNVKWTFGMPGSELDPLWISAVEVGDKIVKEMCKPVYRTWTDEIPHYKTCIQEEVYEPINKTTIKAFNYTCLDYIERIEHINEQIDCITIGKVNVSGKLYSSRGYYCKLIDNEVCCASNIDGGEYASWYRKDMDSSVDIQCQNLINDKIIVYDTTKKRVLT